MTTEETYDISELVNLYSGRIYGLALRLTKNKADAEDVLQETFLKVMEKLDTFEGRSNIYTWIHRIGTNIALGKLRKLSASPDVDIVPEDFDKLVSGQSSQWDLENSFGGHSADYIRDAVDKATAKLPEGLRRVFLLRDVEEYSTAETAAALGLTESNVKVRLMRARIALRDRLADLYPQAGKSLS